MKTTSISTLFNSIVRPNGYRPFRQNSIWNTPVSAGVATTALANTTGNIQLDSWNSPIGSPSRPSYSLPIYYAKASDPLIAVWYGPNNWGHVNTDGYPRWGITTGQQTTIKSEWFNSFNYVGRSPAPGMSGYATTTQSSDGSTQTAPTNFHHHTDASPAPLYIHVPGGFAYPASGSDGPIAIYQPNGTVFEGYNVIWMITGELTCSEYAIVNANDYGDGWNNGLTASMIPYIAGNITQTDANAGVINHALAITIAPNHLTGSIVYPAYAMDRDGAETGGNQYTGNSPVGSRFIIPASTDITSHTWESDIGLIVAKATQKYGMIAVDRGGSTGASIKVEASVTQASWNTFSTARSDDLTFIYQNWLVRVTTPYFNLR